MKQWFRRQLALVLVLVLMLAVMPLAAAPAEDGLRVVRSVEEGFSARTTYDHVTWRSGVGLYLWLTPEEEYDKPYLLVSVDASKRRVTDGAAYFRDETAPGFERNHAGEQYAIQQHEGYRLGSRSVDALEYEYREKEGYRVWQFMAYDVREDRTVFLRCRCSDPQDRQRTLAALDALAGSLQFDPDYYGDGTAQPAEAQTDRSPWDAFASEPSQDSQSSQDAPSPWDSLDPQGSQDSHDSQSSQDAPSPWDSLDAQGSQDSLDAQSPWDSLDPQGSQDSHDSQSPQDAPSPEQGVVQCREGGFTIRCSADAGTKWEDGQGLYVYTRVNGKIPYVLMNVLEPSQADVMAHLRDNYTPHMKEKYGDDLFAVFYDENFQAGGRAMPAARYIYDSDAGDTITMLRVYDQRADCTVVYTVKYILDDDRAPALSALDEIVAGFRLDVAPGQGAAPDGRSDTSAPADLNGYTVTRDQPIVTELVDYECEQFTARLPANWKICDTGVLENYSFRCYDPDEPQRCVFYIGQLGPWLKSQQARKWRQANPTGLDPKSVLNDNAPVLTDPSMPGLIGSMERMREYLEFYYPKKVSVETLNPRVLPDIHQGKVVQTFPGPGLEALRQWLNQNAVLMYTRDISVHRFNFVSSEGAACEGMMGGMILEGFDPNLIVNPNGLDLWFHYGLCLMGFTAPMGELQELAPAMFESLGSFRFTDSYLKQAASKGKVMAQASDLSSAQRSLTDAWEDREERYDIASQKYSDATLGYDRLYDSETGEIYRADPDFYGSYDSNRYAFSNPNLYQIGPGDESYYLQGVDYYIGK